MNRKQSQIPRSLVLFLFSFLSITIGSAQTVKVAVDNTEGKQHFPLISKGVCASIYYDDADHKVVELVAGHLADDIELVSSYRPETSLVNNIQSKYPVIIGTLGHNQFIDSLVASGKIDVSAIKGQWESFIITTVKKPAPGIKQALVITGSDRRGTAYGSFTLSESIGVSPWYWWADIIPEKQEEIYIKPKTYLQSSPSVKYRGIFINDEGFGGLNVWACKTYETEIGDIGPKTYARVFELMLRLKANLIWPAMHACTKPFYCYKENPVVADNYAIVVGTSHLEQMHCNTMTEWDEDQTGPWNYFVNRERIQSFWQDRVDLTKGYENFYTLGMRGTEDIEMQGAESVDDMVRITDQSISDQREILKNTIGQKAEEIPQVLCTYKEVLVTYQNGLDVPDDVTLLWADDNHGYTRQLCTPEEQKRSGGSGVYYHLSLLGTPEDYLWLNTISPSLVAYEMTKAYEYGADRIWMFNIGDIKPHEKELTFALQMAYDINRWMPSNAHLFLAEWAEDTFGKELADDITAILENYYRLAESGKPEHCYRLDYSPLELDGRIEAYRSLSGQVAEMKSRVPETLLPAYYQLVEYPVLGCRWINERNLMARRSLQKAAIGDMSALDDAQLAHHCHTQLDSITHYYNAINNDGKWNHIMCWHPWMSDEMPDVASKELVQLGKKAPKSHTVVLEDVICSPQLTFKDGVLKQESMSEQHQAGEYTWQADKEGEVPVWIFATIPTSYVPSYKLTINGGEIKSELKHIGNIWHTQAAAPVWYKLGHAHLNKGSNTMQLSLPDSLLNIGEIHLGWYPPSRQNYKKQMMAEDYVKSKHGQLSTINVVSGLGLGKGVCIMPFTSPSLNVSHVGEAAWVEYDIELSGGQSEIEIRTLPTQRIHDGRTLSYAVSINGEEPVVFDVQADEFTPEWQDNVIRGFTSRKISYSAKDSEPVKLRIYFLDPGLVIRDIVVN
ncbi:glycosyl hydrolase 115 family protein [Carboxylicivirga marina]|uniref:Glycosyl hydrolase 115 family protein n=1 Tax=Carboxylicivirga marina TaxID=2800988 RepID=A0ABS1HET2_9BACT|nr:glycosyl hydrolase 115 family protein [Carboxylicivirga marina]MBK3516186.1 glycosyl hydrolase 115 family protein [Carboxylicivirga marina]